MKYYIVPITEKRVFYKGKSLYELLKETYPELGQREDQRIEIVLSHNMFEEDTEVDKMLIKHNNTTHALYESNNLPPWIILEETETEIHEYITHEPLKAKTNGFIKRYAITQGYINEYIKDSDYENKVRTYFKKIKSKKGPTLTLKK